MACWNDLLTLNYQAVFVFSLALAHKGRKMQILREFWDTHYFVFLWILSGPYCWIFRMKIMIPARSFCQLYRVTLIIPAWMNRSTKHTVPLKIIQIIQLLCLYLRLRIYRNYSCRKIPVSFANFYTRCCENLTFNFSQPIFTNDPKIILTVRHFLSPFIQY